jgi:uncharacterized protein
MTSVTGTPPGHPMVLCYLVEIDLSDDMDARARTRPGHREWVSRLASEGKITAAGPYVEGSGAFMFTGITRPELEALLTQDPYHQEHLITQTRIKTWEINFGSWMPASTAV